MIEQLFNVVLTLSIQGAITSVIIYIITSLFKNKLVQRFKYMIWILVFVKLILPFNIPSMFSLYNYIDLYRVYTNSPVELTDSVNPIDNQNTYSINQETFKTNDLKTINDNEKNWIQNFKIFVFYKVNWNFIISYSWFFITLSLFVYFVINYFYHRNKIMKHKNDISIDKYQQLFDEHFFNAGVSRKKKIILSSYAKSPFVFGFFSPMVVLPEKFNEIVSYEELKAVIYHEMTHIKLRHNQLKIMAYVITLIHWFNPFTWLAFKLMQNEAEFYCDYQVVSKMRTVNEHDYLSSLLKVARLKQIEVIPSIHFGQNNLKRRVLNIMNKKSIPKYTVILSCAIIFILTIILFTSAPMRKSEINFNDYTFVGMNVKNISFGMTKNHVEKEVIKSELEGQDIEITSYLNKDVNRYYSYYTDYVFGTDIDITMEFTEDLLSAIRCGFLYNHEVTQDFYNSFLFLKNGLSDKYGESTSDDIIWEDDQYIVDTEDYGTALSLGHLSFEVAWKTDTTEIYLQCRLGSNDKILIQIYYAPVGYFEKSGVESSN